MTRAEVLGAVVLALAGAAGCGKSGGGGKQSAAGSATASGSAGGSAAAGSAAAGDEATAVEPEPSAVPVPPAGSHTGTAAFALSGALTAKLEGAAECICSDDTASFTVKGGTLAGQPMPVELRVLVATAEDWNNPPVLLTVPEPTRGTYARNTYKPRPTDKVHAAKDCSGVTLDVVLRGMAGTKGEIALKGAISCTK